MYIIKVSFSSIGKLSLLLFAQILWQNLSIKLNPASNPNRRTVWLIWLLIMMSYPLNRQVASNKTRNRTITKRNKPGNSSASKIMSSRKIIVAPLDALVCRSTCWQPWPCDHRSGSYTSYIRGHLHQYRYLPYSGTCRLSRSETCL